MSLQEKHYQESNLLAFKFSCIIQFFEILSTVLYQGGRVGFVNTAIMLVMQGIIFVASVAFFIMFKGKTRGKYLMLGCLAAGYLVVMLGSVHITYIWAFGPALVILSLLYADLALTLVTSIFTIAINFLYIPLFSFGFHLILVY